MSTTVAETRSHRLTSALSGRIITLMIALFVIAFGGGFLVSQGLQHEPQGLARDSVVTLIDDQIAALNAADEQALAATFAQDAVLTDEVAGIETTGAAEIARTYATSDIHVTRTSEVVMQGDYASHAFEYDSIVGADRAAVAVFQIEDGKIVHQWIIGE